MRRTTQRLISSSVRAERPRRHTVQIRVERHVMSTVTFRNGMAVQQVYAMVASVVGCFQSRLL